VEAIGGCRPPLGGFKLQLGPEAGMSILVRTLETAERADANFVVYATWALERTAGMVARVRDDLVVADSGLPCDTFNFICRARLDSSAARSAATRAITYFAEQERPFSWWLLRDGRHAGCDLAVLQAAAAGVGLYQRLGFAGFGEITKYQPCAFS
jgi:hypothetical protein